VVHKLGKIQKTAVKLSTNNDAAANCTLDASLHFFLIFFFLLLSRTSDRT